MNKLRLILVAACALAAFFAVSGSASALTDPDCDGTPYGNESVVHEFWMETPSSQRQHDVSRLHSGWLACGTDVRYPHVGKGTLYNHFDIAFPPGVQIAETTGHENELVGTGYATYLAIDDETGNPVLTPGYGLLVYADDSSECERENGTLVGGPAAGELIACYLLDALPGAYAWAWVTHDGNYRLTIGPLHAPVGPAGFSRLDLRLCGYFTCVADIQWTQKNGDASFAECPGGLGRYTIMGTRNDGRVTPAASDCIQWSATKSHGLWRAAADPFGGSW